MSCDNFLEDSENKGDIGVTYTEHVAYIPSGACRTSYARLHSRKFAVIGLPGEEVEVPIPPTNIPNIATRAIPSEV